MNSVLRLSEFQLRDVIRSRGVIVYAVFIMLAADLLLRFTAGARSALLGIGSVTLLVVPLITLIFGTLYVYSARPFHELLLTQPVARRQLFAGVYAGVTLPLAGAFVLGAGAPFVYLGLDESAGVRSLLVVLLTGAALTLVFVGIALLIAFTVRDRLRGVALAVGVWLALALLYDSVVLLVVTGFAAYPLERPMIALMLLNPIDLCRLLLLLDSDAAALMGYTGAVLTRTLGAPAGRALAGGALIAWLAVPPLLACRALRRSDL